MAEARDTSDETVTAHLQALITDAVQYADTTLAPYREKALRYYRGDPFGNEEDGRSQLVLTEVRDGIMAVLPSLLRLFFGPERVVEFVSRTPDPQQIQDARDATDVIHKAFVEDNGGFLLTHSVLKDGLLQKLGAFMYAYETIPATQDQLTVRSPEEAAALEGQGIQILDAQRAPDGMSVVLTIQQGQETGRLRVWAVPTEEFIYTQDAKSLDDATLVGRRRELTTSELLDMGVDEDFIEEHGGTSSGLEFNAVTVTRRESVAGMYSGDVPSGEANARHLYVEAYVYLDVDGDGRAELRRMCTLGPGYTPIPGLDEAVEFRPFALFCPDPEPHTLIGGSWADRLMDMQLYKSSLVRAANDSAALSIFPRTWVVDGKANLQDVQNTEIGATIRVKDPQAVGQFKHEFLGDSALNLLAYADDVIERRTGRNKGTAGLDAGSLQSSTREGVTAVLTTSQEQVELVARIFAEQTLKPLFRGMLRLLVNHGMPSRVRIRGEYIEVNPSQWDPQMDVAVNVALGTGFLDSRVNDLMLIATKQEQILQQLGPSNPLCTLAQYRNTMARILEAKGFRDVDAFLLQVDPNWQPPQADAPPPTPEQVTAQAMMEIERMKTGKELDIKEAELKLQMQESERKHQFDLMKLEAESALKRLDIELKYSTALKTTQMTTAAEQTQAEGDRLVKVFDLQTKHAHNEANLDHQHQMNEQAQEREDAKAEHAMSMAEQEPAGEAE